jgi:hypothetical protein
MNQLSFSEQITLARAPLDDAKSALDAELLPRLAELADMAKKIEVKRNADYLSLKAGSAIAARILIRRNGVFLEIKSKHKDLFSSLEQKPLSAGMLRITFRSLDELLVFSNELCTMAVKELSSLSGEGFACCHLYEECSNARRCIQPSNLFSLACYYRRNLEQGKIFYGKNRNT